MTVFRTEPVEFVDVRTGDWIQPMGVWDLPARVIATDVLGSQKVLMIEGETVSPDGRSRVFQDRIDPLTWQRLAGVWVRFPALRNAIP